MSTATNTQGLPPSEIPIFTSLKDYRSWRNEARMSGKTVGFVPTMGALHDGHLSLGMHLRRALDRTVSTIDVSSQVAGRE
jgi:pantoate--beta-alanine ligase